MEKTLTIARLLFRSMPIYLALSLIAPVCAFSAPAEASSQQNQQITLRGKVTNERGEPLVGVTIVVPGTTAGTSTQVDGSYELRLPASAGELEFSYLSYKTARVAVGSRTVIDVILEEDSMSIDQVEVVVTGYGNIAQESYTGSATVMSAAKIGDRAIASMEGSIRGNVTGALVTSTGQPGIESEIRLRGIGSANASNQPLFVVDGVIWDQDNMSGNDYSSNNPLNTLNASDIESYTVLRDAASASLYGSRGANGVIVITTKQGKLDSKVNINLSVQAGVSLISRTPDLVSGREYADLWVEGQMHANIYNSLGISRVNLANELTKLYMDKDNYYTLDGKGYNFTQYQKMARQQFNELFVMPTGDGSYRKYDYFGDDYDKLPDTDWYDLISRVAPFVKTNVSLSGGTKALKYYSSMEYLNQQGVIINSKLERYAIRMKLNSDVKSNFVNWGVNSYVANTVQTGPQAGGTSYNTPMFAALRLPSVIPAYLEDGSYNYSFPLNLLDTSHNPVASAKLNDNEKPQLNITVSGNLKLNFTDWLSLSTNASVYYLGLQRRTYYDSDFGYGSQTEGLLTERDVHRTKLTNTTMLLIDKTFNAKHKISASAGVEFEDLKYKYRQASVGNFLSDSKSYLSNGAVKGELSGGGYSYSQLSFISRADYSYRNRYIVAGSFRQDRSSRFAPENRVGNFWSASGAWRISNENFWKPYRKIVNSLRVKASYGINGNLPSIYYYMLTYSPTEYMGDPGAKLDGIKFEDMTWEKNAIWNFGLDASFLNSRLKFSVEYYTRKTHDLLLDLPVSNTSGSRTKLQNSPTAGIKNSGFEIEVKSNIFENKDWVVNFDFNIATLKAEYYGLENRFPDSKSRQMNANGYSPHSWWLKPYVGINPETGQLQYQGAEKVETSSSNVETEILDKQGIPKVTGGFNLLLAYKNLELSALFSFATGHYIFDRQGSRYTQNDGYELSAIAKSQLDRWTPENTDSSNPLRINNNSYASSNTRFLVKGDYLKLRNLTLGYRMPSKWAKAIRVNSIRTFVQAENLWVLTEMKDYDPELSMDGYRNYDSYPFAVVLTAGISVNF